MEPASAPRVRVRARRCRKQRLLPTKAQLRRELRLAFEGNNRVAHFIFTRSALGELRPWDYFVGSCTACIRRYEAVTGQEK